MNRYRLAACILVGVLVVVFVYISFQEREESSSSTDSTSKQSKHKDEQNEIKKDDSDDEIKENNTIDEGVIKYDCKWTKGVIKFNAIKQLLHARNRLHSLRLIAVDKQTGIGFGNISQRIQKTDDFKNTMSDKVSFYITGSQTNLINNNEMNETHFSIVNNYNICENKLECIGPIRASSESMTHATIYELNNNINCVVHIHNNKLWNICINKLPTTDETVPYGTPQMATEVERLYNEYIKNNNELNGIFVMGGHKNGLIAFGPSIQHAMNLMINTFKKYCNEDSTDEEVSSIDENNGQFKNIKIIENYNYTPTRTAQNDQINGNGDSNGEFVHVDEDPLVI